jgi:hypothetical protein
MAQDLRPPDDKVSVASETQAFTSPGSTTSPDTSAAADTPAVTLTTESGEVAEESGEVPQTETQPPLTIDNLLEAWGSDNPQFDLNGDGTVDIDDLFALLGKMAEDLRDGDGAPPPVGPPENQSGLALNSTSVRDLADTLIDKLSAVGFDQRPPTILPSLIDLLDLGPQYKTEVIQRLSEFYRQGLGVNCVG